VSSEHTSLRCYLIRACDFVNPNPSEKEGTDINQVSDKNFLYRTTKETQKLFEQIMHIVQETNAPFIYSLDVPNSNKKRLLIGFKRRGTKQYFSALSDVFHYHGLNASRKFVGITPTHIDQFSNGVTISSFYLENSSRNLNKSIESIMTGVMEEASLIYCLPENPLVSLVQKHELSGN
jgi:glutamate dehydrogenase